VKVLSEVVKASDALLWPVQSLNVAVNLVKDAAEATTLARAEPGVARTRSEGFPVTQHRCAHAPLRLVLPACVFAAPQSVASLCSQSFSNGSASHIRDLLCLGES
jgi:hypothetical protein